MRVKMQIKRIINKYIGPIKEVDVELDKNDKGNPKPILIVGENGSGKTTLISNIVDAIYEMARLIYNNAVEKSEEGYQYYKAITPVEINIGQEYMLSYIEFSKENSEDILCQYIFKSGNLSYDEFSKQTNIHLTNNNSWKESFKNISATKETLQNEFDNNIFCYFGPDRYEKPQWMGEKYYNNLDEYSHPTVKARFNGELETPIAIKNVTTEILQWLLDVIVDSRTDIVEEKGELKVAHVTIQDLLQLGIARNNVEKVMSEILGKEVYFGLNFRSARGSRFNIFEKQSQRVLLPTLDALSTGQSALFNMFTTIIRYADINNINKSIKLDEIQGIVVIDEIELHLHSKLQREVLPKLIKLFPKVQFIITTHSPLFLLGMDEQFGKEEYVIYQMPTADRISAESFSEFQRSYIYMTNTEKYRNEIKNAINSNSEKTLIVTEGATDWRHLKAALKNLSELENDPYEYQLLDVEFLQYNPKNSKKNDLLKLDMSCTHLVTMCEEFAKVKQVRKIIFIADADDKNTCKQLSQNGSKFKTWGNNVYSAVLPIPKHRKETPEICIEHYYTDKDLQTPIVINGIERRIYMGGEFDNLGLSLDKKLMCIDRNSCGQGKIRIIDGQSDKRVFRIEDESKENLALPKMDFAEAIYNLKEEMKNIDFTEFHLIFDIIKEIQESPME